MDRNRNSNSTSIFMGSTIKTKTMKKLLTFLTIVLPISVMSQILDTVYVRTLTMPAKDWSWVVGKNASSINGDSLTIVAFRKIRAAAQSVQNPTWDTNITIDSIPGRIVLGFYQTAKTANAGEIVSRYTAITTAIAAKTVLAYWIGRIDEAVSSDYNRAREIGKQILLDQ